MKKISRRSLLMATGVIAASAALSACGGSSASTSSAGSTAASTAASGTAAPALRRPPDRRSRPLVSSCVPDRSWPLLIPQIPLDAFRNAVNILQGIHLYDLFLIVIGMGDPLEIPAILPVSYTHLTLPTT